MPLQTGEIIDGKYRVVREIGSGAMGSVYEGENVRIKRRVAIKVLHRGVADEVAVKRFEREAQAAGRIGSEHIVEVLDLGQLPDTSYYMVMEFLEGVTLTQRIKSMGRLVPREIVPIAQQLLTGLEAAHQAQIIHRDLKPDNVFLLSERAGQKDFVKILDFGISKFNPLTVEEAMGMTKAGTVLGTPFYMSPEQAQAARDIDHRSDLYSVGVILYQCITGQVPFHAGTFNELIFKIVLETPPPPETFVPDLDPGFGQIIRKAITREREERYQGASELRDALSVWLHTGAPAAPPAHVAPPTPLPPPPASRRSMPTPPPPTVPLPAAPAAAAAPAGAPPAPAGAAPAPPLAGAATGAEPVELSAADVVPEGEDDLDAALRGARPGRRRVALVGLAAAALGVAITLGVVGLSRKPAGPNASGRRAPSGAATAAPEEPAPIIPSRPAQATAGSGGGRAAPEPADTGAPEQKPAPTAAAATAAAAPTASGKPSAPAAPAQAKASAAPVAKATAAAPPATARPAVAAPPPPPPAAKADKGGPPGKGKQKEGRRIMTEL